MADLVARLRLDDKQFNNNIKRSKKEMKDLGNVAQTVGKTISKAFIALEAAKAVLDTFKLGIDSSAEASKQFSSVIDTAKTTVSNFFSSLISGNWKPFEKGIKESIKLAKEFNDAMFEQAKVQEYGSLYADYLEGRRNNIEHIITSDNSTNAEKKAAQAEYTSIGNKEIGVRQSIIDKSYQAINLGLKTKGIDTEYTLEQLLELSHYVQSTAEALTEEQKAFKDLINSTDFKPHMDAIANQTDKIGTIKKDMDDALSDINKVNSEEQEVSDLDLAAFNAQGWANMEVKGMNNQLRQAIESGDKIPIKELPIEIEDEAFEEFLPTKLPDEPSKWAIGINESFALAGSSIMALGSAFAAFSDNAALGKSALILGAIGQLIYSYASSATKAKNPWEWIAFAISGAATLATVIGQIKGYASGGIIDSPYTTGDRNLIKVNGGEMVLTKGQQSNLFSMLNNGVNSTNGGNVTFTIKGKELVGVLNNYNNKVSKVL